MDNGMLNKFSITGELVNKNLKAEIKNGINVISGEITVISGDSIIPIRVSCSEYTAAKQLNKNWNTYVQLMNAPTKASNESGTILSVLGTAYSSEGYGKDSNRYYCIPNNLRGTFINLNPSSIKHNKWWSVEGFIDEIITDKEIIKEKVKINDKDTIREKEVDYVLIKLINIGFNDRVNRFEIKSSNPEYIAAINTNCYEKMPISCNCDIDFISTTETEEIAGMIGSITKTRTITRKDFIIKSLDSVDRLNDEYPTERMEKIMANHEIQMKNKNSAQTSQSTNINVNTFATAVNNFASAASNITPPDLGF